jgi:hypothetical protein
MTKIYQLQPGATTGFEAEVLTRIAALETEDGALDRSIDQGQNPSVSDGPDDYPQGWTFNTLSSATGWPIATGLVETFIYDDSRGYQIVRGKTKAPSYQRWWASSTTWSNWVLAQAQTHGGISGSSYTLTATSTFEEAFKLTITDYPTSSFEAQVSAWGHCSSSYSGAAFTSRIDLQISLDGGSTWNGSPNPRQSGNSTWNVSHAAGYSIAGAVTGSIQARIRGYSSQLAIYDEFDIEMIVAPNL